MTSTAKRKIGASWLCYLVLMVLITIVTGTTSLRDGGRRPRTFMEGETALLTCVVRNVGNNTVLWKRVAGRAETRDSEILTASDKRVTSDRRFSVLHEDGGEVYVLSIHDVREEDEGMYVCEVNSDPPLESFHELKVSKAMSEDGSDAPEDPDQLGKDYILYSDTAETGHDFTNCCKTSGVSNQCLGFCNLDDIMKGKTRTDPDLCDSEFPSIIKCMADGRDHTPCCHEDGVPDLCLEICRGDYTVHTDNIKTHFSCSAFTSRILNCVAIGVATLPPPLKNVQLTPTSDTEIEISWEAPTRGHRRVQVDNYVINITRLGTFDSIEDDFNTSATNNSEDVVLPKAMQIKVPADRNSTKYVITNLTEYTMYEISMVSVNERGSSLPSLRMRTLTLPKGLEHPTAEKSPNLPDIPGCCREKGVEDDKCIDIFCDPRMDSPASVPKMMVCAPWVPSMIQCLAQGGDHSPCCREKGLPEPCPDLCTGNVTRIDYRYFKCIRHFSEISNCLLKGYGVLPSAPRAVDLSEIGSNFAVAIWDRPEKLTETVKSYTVHYRLVGGGDRDYVIRPNAHPPFLLDGLKADSYHEFFVEAVNEHGAGDSSTRLIFKTVSERLETALDNSAYQYNITACCVAAKVEPDCLELCNYEAKMSSVKTLAVKCSAHMHALVRCAAGGRDHSPCCQRSGVHGNCMPLCAGKLPKSMGNPSFCLGYIGNIVQCFEEGTGKFPSPPMKFHAIRVTNTSVTVGWEAPKEGEFSGYELQYQKYNSLIARDIPLRMERSLNVSASDKSATVEGLEPNQNYVFTVVAYNDYGSSLPSSILDLNISELAYGGRQIDGHPPPPHSLTVTEKTATSLQIVWMPPDYSHPTETITYRLFWRKLNTSSPAAADSIPMYNSVDTSVVSAKLDNLSPNSQYVMYVVCMGEQGMSGPSETLLAWTDPFYPAFVEPPTVQPSSLIVEGHSVTVVCIAMGEPTPNVSLFVSGRLLKNETTRHLVHTIQNISREMDQLSCYADNGYGTPAQASRNIVISRGPRVSVPDVVFLPLGKAVKLECAIDAFPRPVMRWSRDRNQRSSSIIHGGKYKIEELEADSGFYVMRLTINPVTEDDSGNYYCHAENAFGNNTQELVVQQRQKPTKVMNVTACCVENNVSDYCLSSCVFDLDFGAVVDDPRCISEYHKLMRCGSDESDHRSCCSKAGVPKRCLDWCRGEEVPSAQLCLVSWTKQMINCFEEGKTTLPGRPTNVRIETMDHNSAVLAWDPPQKNAYAIQLYRVYWRPHGGFLKSETKETRDLFIRIDGLKDELTYEVAVKAGNHYGSSQLSETAVFTTQPVPPSSYSAGAIVVGVLVALIVVVTIVGGVICYARKGKLFEHKTLTESVSFENPSYMRDGEAANQSVQQNEPGPDGNQAEGRPKTSSTNGVTPSPCPWKDEALYASEQQENNDAGLDVSEGYKSVGFQRFKNEL